MHIRDILQPWTKMLDEHLEHDHFPHVPSTGLSASHGSNFMHVLTNTRFPWYPHVNETYSRGSGSCQARLARSARQTSGPVKVGTWTARLAGPMARMIVIPMIVILQETWTESVGKKHLTVSHKKQMQSYGLFLLC